VQVAPPGQSGRFAKRRGIDGSNTMNRRQMGLRVIHKD
jgi:hypothetical protein